MTERPRYKCWVTVPFKKSYGSLIKTLKSALGQEGIGIELPKFQEHADDLSSLVSSIRKEISLCDLMIADMTELRIGVLTEVLWGMEFGKPIIVISNARGAPRELPRWVFDFDNQIGPLSRLDNFEYLTYFSNDDLREYINYYVERLLPKKKVADVVARPGIQKPALRIGDLTDLWNNVISLEFPTESGERFEDFVVNLVDSVNGLTVTHRRFKSEFGEFDIIVRNNKRDRPWLDMPYFFPIECKWKSRNRKVKVGELREFIVKVQNLKPTDFGLMISNTDFTRDLVRERNRTSSREGMSIGLIGGKAINRILEGEFNPDDIIMQAFQHATLGGR